MPVLPRLAAAWSRSLAWRHPRRAGPRRVRVGLGMLVALALWVLIILAGAMLLRLAGALSARIAGG